jgi:hypothetical protein
MYCRNGKYEHIHHASISPKPEDRKDATDTTDTKHNPDNGFAKLIYA